MIERMRVAAASGAGEPTPRRVVRGDRAARAGIAGGRQAAHDRVDRRRLLPQQRVREGACSGAQRYFREGGTSGAIRTHADPEPVPQRRLRRRGQGADGRGRRRPSARAARPPRTACKLLPTRRIKQNDNNALRRRAGEAGHLLPEEGVLGRPAEPPAAQAELLRPARRSTSTACSLATGSMTAPNDYMEMAQLALQAGFAAEGKQVVDKGFAARRARHRRRRPSATSGCATWSTSARGRKQDAGAEDEKQALAAKDGNALVNVGMNHVYDGQAAQGPAADAAGHRQGRPEAPRGRQAAPRRSPSSSPATTPRRRPRSRPVQGNDGTADLARLWALYARPQGA